MKDGVVIVGAARTPVGSFNGSLSSLSAHVLGKIAIEGALSRAGIEGKQVSEVILGQENVGKAMALEMVVVVAIVMGLYAWLDRRAGRWTSR